MYAFILTASLLYFLTEAKNLDSDGLSGLELEDDCFYLAQFPTWFGTCTWGECWTMLHGFNSQFCQTVTFVHILSNCSIDGGYGFGPCEMPNTMIVEDTSGDGSGSTSLMTRSEMPGPCICEGKVV